ncbi:MAG: EF-hand domain-containing protein, partial [Planctomycetaceae bacterium]|nr:EF-hand domain-containing protein [Planctomycetaceae bacterium]
IDATEMRNGVLLAYGVQRPGGGLSRFGDGRVFNEHYYRQFDKDGDRVLASDEFETVPERLNRTAEQIAALDANADGRVEMSELDAGELFRADTVHEYLRWDRDRDGTITNAELTEGKRGYDSQIAEEMFPAFDLNHDERIELAEFLSSPLADGSFLGNDRRRDADHDLAVSPQEFFPRGGLALSGLAALYFDRLDLNGDDRLDRGECRFEVDLSRLPAEVAFDWFDADQNQAVSLSEAFGAETPEQLLAPRSQLVFTMLDRDGNGGLVPDELSSLECLVSACEAERILREEVQPQFRKLDQGPDGSISETEWTTGITVGDAAAIHTRFVRADLDGNGGLDLLEYADHLGASRPTWPLFNDALRQRLDMLIQELLENAGDDRAVAAIARASETARPFATSNDVRSWDVDRNGTLDWTELDRGIGIAYGLRSPMGRSLSNGRGAVFNARHFAGIDKDRDGFLTRQEFTSTRRSAEELAGDFTAADANRDARISFEESLDVQWLWMSADHFYARLDPDKDQQITAAELALKVEPWEQQVASWTLLAFDTDGSGSLSRGEYQLSPIAAPFSQWSRPLVDQDGDDRIVFDEFHPRTQAWLRGLSAEFFTTLDRDDSGSLTADEATLTIDLKTAPLATIFRKFDRDLNGQLSVTETIEGRGKSTNHGWIMQTEDAFYAADTDRSGALSVEEFTAPETTVALLASGRPLPPKPRGGRRPATAQAAADAVAQDSDWDKRMIVLIALNVLLVAGAGWYLLRTPSR